MTDDRYGLPERFSILDHSDVPYEGDALVPFAVEEVLCRKVGDGRFGPILHLWRHRGAMVLGLRDRRLPKAVETIDALRNLGEQVVVRHSGGAAVPLDTGVVNVSWIDATPRGRLEHRSDFERMYRLIAGFQREAWGAEIEKGEVPGSYCPGDFDLSIGHRKFCGLSQRRQTKAFIVQAFILVDGVGAERAKRARRFYDSAAGENGPCAPADYPRIDPSVMISVAEALGTQITAETWSSRFADYLADRGGRRTSLQQLATEGGAEFGEEVRTMVGQLRRRYDIEE